MIINAMHKKLKVCSRLIWCIFCPAGNIQTGMWGIQHSLMDRTDGTDPWFSSWDKKTPQMSHPPPCFHLMSQPTACLIGWGQSPPAVCNQEHLGVRLTWHPQGTHAHLDIYIQSACIFNLIPLPTGYSFFSQDHLQMCTPCSHLRIKKWGWGAAQGGRGQPNENANSSKRLGGR